MRSRKSPEEKAAERRAAWDREVAATAAKEDAAERKRQAAIARETAARSQRVEAKAAKNAREGRPTRFSHLEVAVQDGTVYTTKDGIRPLGPLARAHTTFLRMPDKVIRISAASQLLFGEPSSRKQPTAVITVSAGRRKHAAAVDGATPVQQAEEQVKDFNVLADQGRSKAPT
jgi:hypothetical protein